MGRLHASLPLRFDFVQRPLKVIRRNLWSVFGIFLISWSVLIRHSKHLVYLPLLVYLLGCRATLLNLIVHPRLVRRQARNSRNLLQGSNGAASSSLNSSAALISFPPALSDPWDACLGMTLVYRLVRPF